MVNPIPEGCNSINAYIIVPNAKDAIAFYEKAFGAEPASGPTAEVDQSSEVDQA